MFKILVAEDDASTNRLFCAILRRARIVDERKITAGDVVLDYDAHTVRRGHEVQTLPPPRSSACCINCWLTPTGRLPGCNCSMK